MARAYTGIVKPITVVVGVFLSLQLAFGWVHASIDVECQTTGLSLYNEHLNSADDSMDPASHGTDCQNNHCVNCFTAVGCVLTHSVPVVSNVASNQRVLNLQIHQQPHVKPPRAL